MRANSVDELAFAIDVPPHVLRATVAARSGARVALPAVLRRALLPVPCPHRRGLTIDAEARVLDETGEPLPVGRRR